MKHELNREFADHDAALALAQKGIAELAGKRNDRWYPRYHIAGEAGWTGAPNGLCRFKDRWHVFYQLHPYDAACGPMHWGHVSSADLVVWRREPIALAPNLDADNLGVFSGSAVVGDDERLWVYYTGLRRDGNGDEHETQCAAVSDDGVHFEKLGVQIECPDGYLRFRDPKVWKQDKAWCMVLGASTTDHRGQVLLYTSENMRIWHFNGVLFQHPNPGVSMLEFPDFFPIDDHEGHAKWVLAFSAIGEPPNGFSSRNANNAGYILGTWDPDDWFKPQTEFRMWDWGHNYYAPQTVLAPDGRRLQIAWMSSFVPPFPTRDHDGWMGQLTLPRVVTLDDYGCVRVNPVDEELRLRTAVRNFGAVFLNVNETRTLMRNAESVEIEMDIDLLHSSAERAGLKVHDTADNTHTCIYYDSQIHRVVLDRHAGAHGDRGYRAAPFTSQGLRLRVFVDRGSVEVFINDGEQVMTSYSYAADGPRTVELMAESGTMAVSSLKIHTLGAIGLE